MTTPLIFQITDYVYISSCESLKHIKKLVTTYKIKRLLNCAEEIKVQNVYALLTDYKLQYYQLKLQDKSTKENIFQYFDLSYKLIDDSVCKKERVLVFCNKGISRSPTIILSYLLHKYRGTLVDTFIRVKNQLRKDGYKYIICPNMNYFNELIKLEKNVLGVNSISLKEYKKKYYLFSTVKNEKVSNDEKKFEDFNKIKEGMLSEYKKMYFPDYERIKLDKIELSRINPEIVQYYNLQKYDKIMEEIEKENDIKTLFPHFDLLSIIILKYEYKSNVVDLVLKMCLNKSFQLNVMFLKCIINCCYSDYYSKFVKNAAIIEKSKFLAKESRKMIIMFYYIKMLKNLYIINKKNKKIVLLLLDVLKEFIANQIQIQNYSKKEDILIESFTLFGTICHNEIVANFDTFAKNNEIYKKGKKMFQSNLSNLPNLSTSLSVIRFQLTELFK